MKNEVKNYLYNEILELAISAGIGPDDIARIKEAFDRKHIGIPENVIK